MIIDQLPAIQLPIQGTDEIPIERGQLTYKGQVQNLPSGLQPRYVQQVTEAGTFTRTLTGLTSEYVVAAWRLTSDLNGTPIPENAPPCDITVETGADTWTYTIENLTSAFYFRPLFIKG